MHKAIITPIIALCAIEAIAHTTDSIKSQPSAIEITIGSAIGLATNAATTEVLKYSIHEMRPDGSGNNSFPSRHSSWAFAASTLASNYLYRHSPWYSLGAQFIATGIGAQRIVARRHYASDVVAGSLLGIASAELGTFVARKIFGSGSGLSFYDVENDFRTTVSMNTGAAYPLGSPSDAHLCAAYMAAVRAAIPIDGRWGVSQLLHPSKVRRGSTSTHCRWHQRRSCYAPAASASCAGSSASRRNRSIMADGRRSMEA